MTDTTHVPNHHHQHLEFPATSLAVRTALNDLFAGLKPLALPVEESGSIELVLAEVLNNIVEHAYADRPNGMIKLTITGQDNGFLFETIDSGVAMPEGQVPLGNRVLLEEDLNALPEGGFGWFLIRDLARDLQYSRENGKNRLTFRIVVDAPAATSAWPADEH